MPSKPTLHSDPRSPLVFDARTLGRLPGAARSESRVVPAPEDLRVALARVPAGTGIQLAVRLEAVSGGVLVTAEATAPVTGECARCLEPVASSVEVRFREFYEHDGAPAAGGKAGQEDGEQDDEDRRFLDGDLLDLEQALRDAMVLALPLAPLCRADCAGLCPECGVRLAEAGPAHDHGEALDPRWARLRQLDPAELADGARAGGDGARAAERQEG